MMKLACRYTYCNPLPYCQYLIYTTKMIMMKLPTNGREVLTFFEVQYEKVSPSQTEGGGVQDGEYKLTINSSYHCFTTAQVTLKKNMSKSELTWSKY